MVFKPRQISLPKKAEVLDETTESEDEEMIEESEEEEEQEEPVKEVKQTEKQITVNDVLLNHEERLKSLEAAFFRLKNL